MKKCRMQNQDETFVEVYDMCLRKRIVTIALCALCLMLGLTSCFYYPDTNAEYDVTFYDTYFVEDYNLRHLDLNGWEGTIKLGSEADQNFYWDTLRVATIPQLSEFHFVVGNRMVHYVTGGRATEELFVYQSKGAPIPRKEWTIAEINIIPGSLGSRVNTQTPDYKTHYRDQVENAEVLYSWRKEGANSALSEELQASLEAEPVKKTEAVCKEAEYQTDENKSQGYLLVITFEENHNLAWFAPVYVAQDGYYLGRVCHDVGSREVESFYALGESWNLLLEELIHGAVPTETDTTPAE